MMSILMSIYDLTSLNSNHIHLAISEVYDTFLKILFYPLMFDPSFLL